MQQLHFEDKKMAHNPSNYHLVASRIHNLALPNKRSSNQVYHAPS